MAAGTTTTHIKTFKFHDDHKRAAGKLRRLLSLEQHKASSYHSRRGQRVLGIDERGTGVRLSHLNARPARRLGASESRNSREANETPT